MDLSCLPDDIIKLISSYVDKSPPFAKELLNRKYKMYSSYTGEISETLGGHIEEQLCGYYFYKHNVLKWRGKFLYIPFMYNTPENRNYRCVDWYDDWTTHMIITEMKTWNTKKQLNILSHQQYNCCLSKLCNYKARNFYKWYVYHYD